LLTAAQKRALFRMGKARGIEQDVMVAMMKQSDGVGVTPGELAALADTAKKNMVPKDIVAGFGQPPATRSFSFPPFVLCGESAMKYTARARRGGGGSWR
jgi:hypothetical protein